MPLYLQDKAAALPVGRRLVFGIQHLHTLMGLGKVSNKARDPHFLNIMGTRTRMVSPSDEVVSSRGPPTRDLPRKPDDPVWPQPDLATIAHASTRSISGCTSHAFAPSLGGDEAVHFLVWLDLRKMPYLNF